MSKQQGAVVIVGASSGMGAELVRIYAAQGRPVAALARRLDLMEGIRDALSSDQAALVKVYQHDVLEIDTVAAAYKQIEADCGIIGTLIYAAGALPPIGPDEYDAKKDALIIDVGLRGACAWLSAAATDFGPRGWGTLCGISSIAGDRGRRAFPAYHATKAGLTTYLEALRNRLAVLGVKVVTIKPGIIDTPMTKAIEKRPMLYPADKAAAMIADYVDRGVHTRYVPTRWMFVSWIIRSIPSFIFKRMSI